MEQVIAMTLWWGLILWLAAIFVDAVFEGLTDPSRKGLRLASAHKRPSKRDKVWCMRLRRSLRGLSPLTRRSLRNVH
jgi:hypothetical protein